MTRDEWKSIFWISGAFCIWTVALLLSSILVAERAPNAQPYWAILSVIRVLILVPICAVLSAVALILFDYITPGGWLEHLTSPSGDTGSKIGVALVVASLIYCIFWVAVQG